MVTAPRALKNLVEALKLRKRHPGTPYNILLTSTISLTPDVIKNVCSSTNWETFCRHIYKLKANSHDLVKLLTKYVGIHNNIEGYRALARLILEGYFSTILTTNIDSTLEDLLLEAGLGPNLLQTLIVGYDREDDIIRALAGDLPGICIIKLHGSLREEVLHRQFPDAFDIPAALRESLERYLKRDTVIVGSIMRDEDLRRLLNAREKNRIYYVAPRKSSRDSIVKLIESQGENIERSLISGKYAEFTAFFQKLEEMLLMDRSSPPAPGSVVPASVRIPRGAIPLSNNLFSADVLLVAVTDVEVKAVLACCQDNKLYFIHDRAYHDLGVIGGAKTFLVQSEMGSDGLGGSRFTVQEGILALSPLAVIMVGIAYGLNEKKQRIGDILVSRQLVAYDHQRVGSDLEGEQMLHIRGDRISAPVWLLDRFKAGLQTWQEPVRVRFGLILSGGKLVANQSYRDQLYQIEREAIGGEMEGVGLYEAAQRHHVGWLLVKAISDWADSNKHLDKARRQQVAATNAARFTIHVLKQGGFRDSHIGH
jgi:nucleoside phosphorylase